LAPPYASATRLAHALVGEHLLAVLAVLAVFRRAEEGLLAHLLEPLVLLRPVDRVHQVLTDLVHTLLVRQRGERDVYGDG